MVAGEAGEAGEAALPRYMRPAKGNQPPLDFAPYKATKGRRAITDAGGGYRFITIQPGAYPWGNHHNAWRHRGAAHRRVGVSPAACSTGR